MSTLTTEFAFELGQIVYFRNAENQRDASPRKFIVWERYAAECHGGIQRLYNLGHDPNLKLVPEIALTGERPPYDLTVDNERRLAWESALPKSNKGD